MMTLESLKPFFFPKGWTLGTMVMFISFMLGGGYYLVLEMGGTHLAYVHLLYIPIVLAGLLFSVWGGVIAGLVAGLLMGPIMPADIELSIEQPHASWILRALIFAVVGGLSGLGASLFRAYLHELELKRTTDPLSGLLNLTGLKIWYQNYLKTHKPTAMIVIVAELSHMGKIDRALGTDGTSRLIHYTSRQLQNMIDGKSIIANLQTNRFAIIIPHQTDAAEVLKSCESLSSQTYTLNGIPIFIEMRFGVAIYPHDDNDLNELLRKARIALDKGQKEVKRFTHYDKSTDQNPERNLLILNRLTEAIENKALKLAYQPKIAMGSHKTIGVEALVRWEDPVLGFVPPNEFIPLTEETQLINPFTKWLLEESLAQMERWHAQGYPISVAVNFSMKNFNDAGVLSTLDTLLEKHQIPKKKFEIEVTETSVATNIKSVAAILAKLRSKGIKIAIDDFGTGQSTHQYLYELPLDVIKVDQLFTRDITTNPAAAAIVRSAITLGHELQLEVVAEGIETQEQFDLIRLWGCDVGQGYFMSRPLFADDLTTWLETHSVKKKKPGA
ncbi:EAL and GGDEF domain-containing protein [Candidatus Bealeia paramacronuclearis]|uniref:EAL and GGDEF domain-containing protein n=2 Tax=Candidatus Bealeia paramacronuclearis TaxID=1921001 RepID=A0ABZ2C3H6_9PROT|nr:EAL and GGDEF domain-containing protein [Candidatus Bealeia paramacronuclearis]